MRYTGTPGDYPLYFDEDSMRYALVHALRGRGIDVLTALEAEMIERSDETHLDFATPRGAFGVRVNAVAPGSFPDPEQMSAEAYLQRNAAAAKTVPRGPVSPRSPVERASLGSRHGGDMRLE